MTARFCVKDLGIDNVVSASLAKGVAWELNIVDKVIESMKMHPQAVFLGKI